MKTWRNRTWTSLRQRCWQRGRKYQRTKDLQMLWSMTNTSRTRSKEIISWSRVHTRFPCEKYTLMWEKNIIKSTHWWSRPLFNFSESKAHFLSGALFPSSAPSPSPSPPSSFSPFPPSWLAPSAPSSSLSPSSKERSLSSHSYFCLSEKMPPIF